MPLPIKFTIEFTGGILVSAERDVAPSISHVTGIR